MELSGNEDLRLFRLWGLRSIQWTDSTMDDQPTLRSHRRALVEERREGLAADAQPARRLADRHALRQVLPQDLAGVRGIVHPRHRFTLGA